MKNFKLEYNYKLNLLFVILAFFLSAGYAMAQTIGKENFISYKYEFSLEAIQLIKNDEYNFNLPYEFERYYEKPFGIGAKLKSNKGAFRLKLFYNYNSETDLDNAGKKGIKTGYYHSQTSIGYELHKNFQRTQFYFGVDLIKTNYKINERDYKSYPYNQRPHKKETYSKICWGFGPFTGAKYFITPHFSLSTEISVLFENFKEEYPEDNRERKGFKAYMGPTGILSVNVHL